MVENGYPDFLEHLRYMIATATPGMLINAVIDLSHWNQEIDFRLTKEDGIVGIIHKATQGVKYVDPEYTKRKKAAEKEELLWGAYHFGVGEKSGKDQAEHFLETIGDSSDILLALDIEENKDGKSIMPKQAEDFVNRVYLVTGRLPLIYGSPSFLKDFATPTLTECPLWLAKWGTKLTLPIGWRNWTLWQYTDGQTGAKPHEVEGIGKCDRNKFNGTLKELREFWLV
ncbi:glycoside hydrolase family 25 protein [Wolbachia pipientis]|uniref:glycoside hydrolase family 25 protein n=1 Tax=Wolbachia pipientis TaxID=955 RepID=UPI0020B87671|nr:glycoside hydrolase family 25 protein [Wolbachia pipientis]